MVLCWMKAATKDLREKITRGKIHPNILTAAYLGDIVSGDFYPEYKAPPPNGHATAVTRFRLLFRHIHLDRELNSH